MHDTNTTRPPDATPAPDSGQKPTVEAGVIGVSMAVAGVAAVRAADGSNLLLRVLSAAAFVLAVGGAAGSSTGYTFCSAFRPAFCLPKPTLRAEAGCWPAWQSAGSRCCFAPARSSRATVQDEQLALGLISILAAFLLVVVVVSAWIVMSLW